MKKLVFVFVSSLLCLVLLCGSLLAESGMTLGASIGDSGTIGSSGNGNEETEIPDRIENAIKNGEDIDLSTTGTALTAIELARIAESGCSVRLVGIGYIIELNPSDIPADIGDCDFNISIKAVNETTVIRETVIYTGSVSVNPAVIGDNRLSFKIFINDSFFKETGINDKGKLYLIDNGNIDSNSEIIYNTGSVSLFAEFKMYLSSLCVISEKKPLSSDDEIEVFDPAFGSDDEMEVGDPGIIAEELAVGEEAFAAESEGDSSDEEEFDIGSVTSFARIMGIDGNPATGAASSVVFPIITLTLSAAAIKAKRRKK